MATVRDPAFWKRFSTAVHLNDVESQIDSPIDPDGKKRPSISHQDSWLARQERKKKRRTYICCAFWLGLLAFAAAVVIVVIFLIRSGVL